MIRKRPFMPIGLLVGLLTGLLFLGAAAQGAESQRTERFTKERFEALRAENALILVDISASWCPTCARQGRLIERFRDAHPEVPLHVLQVDFDTQKKWVQHFKAPRQSTLILFRGDERVWFSVAETRKSVIFDAIHAAAS